MLDHTTTSLSALLNPFPRTSFGHLPTPLEPLPRLTKKLNGPQLFIKRDDCTGLAMGGNKVRQLEYYFGEALKQEADTIIITGAVQSNYVRMAAAAAARLGLACTVQLEQRVSDMNAGYHSSGNVLLNRLLGANIVYFPVGEDEGGADHNMEILADQMRSKGKRPYIIYLGSAHPPIGALGYVDAAQELSAQINHQNLDIDTVVLASGSSYTHSGLLAGLRILKSDLKVWGICIRRNRDLQLPRVTHTIAKTESMLNVGQHVYPSDINLTDATLAPGYGCINDAVMEAMKLMGEYEGILLDPVYTAKAFAGLVSLIRAGEINKENKVVFVHTGGTPSIFGYEKEIYERLGAS